MNSEIFIIIITIIEKPFEYKLRFRVHEPDNYNKKRSEFKTPTINEEA